MIAWALAAVLALLLLWFMSGKKGRVTVTAYTMPWCGACKRLQPEWDRLQAMAGPDLEVVKVNCEEDRCSSISRYPTIVCDGREYSGDRTAEAIKSWALQSA